MAKNKQPEQKPKFEPRYFGPLHTYPGMKRDAIILIGLIILLIAIKAISG